MKTLFLTITLFTLNSFGYAPDTYTQYSCNQKCGLTATSQDTVYFMSLSLYDTEAGLKDLCSNRNMQLQGKPSCSENNMNFTNHEVYQRCKADLMTDKKCAVAVVGYNEESQSHENFYSTYSNFDVAEHMAIEECEHKLGYRSTCLIRQYSTINN